MTFEFWSLLTLALLAGAMSPGPSLALIIQTSIVSGRTAALTAALAHGIGVGLYALLVVIGLSQVVDRAPWVMTGLQIAGGLFLLYLGAKMARAAVAARHGPDTSDGSEVLRAEKESPRHERHFAKGFLIVFLNPKIIIFFLAVFSQFLSTAQTTAMQLIAAGLAGVIDAAWYAVVALFMTHPAFAMRLLRLRTAADLAFAGLFCLLGSSALLSLL